MNSFQSRCGRLHGQVELMPIDSYRFLDFASRAWAARQEPGVIPVDDREALLERAVELTEKDASTPAADGGR